MTNKKLQMFWYCFVLLIPFFLSFQNAVAAAGAGDKFDADLRAGMNILGRLIYSLTGKPTTGGFTHAQLENPGFSDEKIKNLYNTKKPYDIVNATTGGLNISNTVLTMIKTNHDDRRAEEMAQNNQILTAQEKAIDAKIKLMPTASTEERERLHRQAVEISDNMIDQKSKMGNKYKNIDGGNIYLKNSEMKKINVEYNTFMIAKKVQVGNKRSYSLAQHEAEVLAVFKSFDGILNLIENVVLYKKSSLNQLNRVESAHIIDIVPEMINVARDNAHLHRVLIGEKKKGGVIMDEAALKAFESEIDNQLWMYEQRYYKIKNQINIHLDDLDIKDLNAQDSVVYRYTPEMLKEFAYSWVNGPDSDRKLDKAMKVGGVVVLGLTILGAVCKGAYEVAKLQGWIKPFVGAPQVPQLPPPPQQPAV